jgi:hypothetical protein
LIVDEKEKELLVPRNISSFFFLLLLPGYFRIIIRSYGGFYFLGDVLLSYHTPGRDLLSLSLSLSASYIFINIDARTTRSRRDTKMEYLGRLSANRRKEQKKKNTPLL